jgi:hypothetical protein
MARVLDHAARTLAGPMRQNAATTRNQQQQHNNRNTKNNNNNQLSVTINNCARPQQQEGVLGASLWLVEGGSDTPDIKKLFPV